MHHSILKLYTPSPAEALELLTTPPQFRGLRICPEALPPAFLLERALVDLKESWRMPRLFCDEVASEIVGSGAFKSEPRSRTVEIGYGIAPACRGRGFATAGITLLVEEAFSSGFVDKVWAETALTNGASQRVLEKAGFVVYSLGDSDEGPMKRWANWKTCSSLV